MEAEADWFVTDYADLEAAMKSYKVAVIGSGAWACAAARMVAQNTVSTPGRTFHETVPMWVYEEEIEVGALVSVRRDEVGI